MIQLPAARPQAGDAGTKVPATQVPPHFFGLAQRNGCGAPKKNAFGACRRRELSFTALCMSRPLIPPSDGFAHRRPCVASLTLAALPRRSPGGQGGGAPDNLPTSTPLQTPQTTSVGGLCPPGASRSPAPASAGGVFKSHFATQNGTHYKTLLTQRLPTSQISEWPPA